MSRASLTEGSPMQTIPDTSAAEVTPFPPATLLVQRRIWIYAGLFLLAIVLLFADQHRLTPVDSLQLRTTAVGASTPPAARLATRDDRPLLLPDR